MSEEPKMVTTGRSCAMLANPHDIIQFSYLEKQALLPEIARLYKKGLSLRDISKHCDISKTAVRSELLRGGIPLREPTGELKFTTWTKKGKTSTKPPFGFCYFEGQVTKHPKEYPILQLIHKRWNTSKNFKRYFEVLLRGLRKINGFWLSQSPPKAGPKRPTDRSFSPGN